jgi:homoserine dehydrogenase
MSQEQVIKRIGIIGLGTVGEAVVRSLIRYGANIKRRSLLSLQIAGVCDKRSAKAHLASRLSVPFTSDPYKLINDPGIDIIVELVGGIEPAGTYICDALRAGKHVVTANKALLAERGRDILSLAAKQSRIVAFEASVCGAIPLIKSISEGLVACEVNKLYGILNGTTNYILWRMEKDKLDFSKALKEAKLKGFAERNPSIDIEGRDTLYKLCILSYLCFGIWPKPADVPTEGIGNISLLDIFYAQEMGYNIKLLAVAKRIKNRLQLGVHPTLIPEGHPLSETSSSYNSVYLDTEPAGDLLFYGKGAGGVPTSSAVISDIVDIAFYGKVVMRREEKVVLENNKDNASRYYVRFMTKDCPGVLAQISRILASKDISIASVTQKQRGRKNIVPIVMVTHDAKEDNIRKALKRIDALPSIKCPSRVIKMESL